MIDTEIEKQPPIDPQLDVPAEANTEHHINFVRLEEDGRLRDDEGRETERRKEWEKGLEEGREKKNKGSA